MRTHALVILALALCPAAAPGDAASVAQIQQRGELIMLCFPHQRSLFAHVDLSKGPMPQLGTAENFAGIDVDLMALFAERLGVELKIRPVSSPSYAALIPDLLAGRGDLIASSLAITAERTAQVDFSQPYFTVHPVVVGRAGRKVAGIDDLKSLRISVVEGSSHHQRLLRLGFDPSRLVLTEFTIEVFDTILDGESDVGLIDSIIAPHSGGVKVGDLEVVLTLPGEEHFGIAVPKESDLRERLDTFLAEMRDSGELEAIVQRHVRPDASAPSDP